MQIFRRIYPVLIGGAIGAVLRFWLEVHLGSSLRFPLGIFVANIGGAFIIGITLTLLPLVSVRSGPILRLLIATGFCGGLTTLSTLAVSLAETIVRLGFAPAITYASATIIAGVLAAILGRDLAYFVFRPGRSI
ncbi:CrcB family protein [Ferrimicrobium sp.]|uniref:fluoride efflux transporter FluC n=1 Tax=Ferrimicrobium sp. TaxID=2926050 RepID=UPI00260DFED6|nr:CrcB family protein [Ferrimicrobium sp.]